MNPANATPVPRYSPPRKKAAQEASATPAKSHWRVQIMSTANNAATARGATGSVRTDGGAMDRTSGGVGMRMTLPAAARTPQGKSAATQSHQPARLGARASVHAVAATRETGCQRATILDGAVRRAVDVGMRGCP